MTQQTKKYYNYYIDKYIINNIFIQAADIGFEDDDISPKSKEEQNVIDDITNCLHEYSSYMCRKSDNDDTLVNFYDVMYDAFSNKIYYDNGLPLIDSNGKWNFFEHYYRDQDWDDIINNYPIADVLLNNNGIEYFVLSNTAEEITEQLKSEYNNADWEHDFGDWCPL